MEGIRRTLVIVLIVGTAIEQDPYVGPLQKGLIGGMTQNGYNTRGPLGLFLQWVYNFRQVLLYRHIMLCILIYAIDGFVLFLVCTFSFLVQVHFVYCNYTTC